MRKEVMIMEKDPVCGMDVDPKNAAAKSIYQGKTYYFCSPGCKRDFDKEPQRYVNLKSDESHMHHSA
jgi:YHS domain-containing protein